MKSIFLILCISVANSLIGQQRYTLNTASSSCHLNYSVYESRFDLKGVFVMLGNDFESPVERLLLCDSSLVDHYRFIEINIVNLGYSSPLDCIYTVIESDAFAKSFSLNGYFVLFDSADVALQPNMINAMYPGNQHNQPSIVNYSDCSDVKAEANFLTSDLNAIHIALRQTVNYQERYEQRLANYRNNFSLGLGMGLSGITGDRFGLKNIGIVDYHVVASRNIGSRFALTFQGGIAIKKPDTRSIQSTLKSEIQSAIQNDEDTVFINNEISGHTGFLVGGSFKYFLRTEKQFRPYVAVSYSKLMLTTMSGAIRDTIDVSDIDMTDLASGGGALAGGDPSSADNANMTTTQYKFNYFSANLGFEYKLGPPVKFDVYFPLTLMQQTNYGTGNKYNLLLGLNLNVHVILNYKKVKGITSF